MGKETFTESRQQQNTSEKKRNSLNIIKIIEATNQWANGCGITLLSEVKENGEVDVTVKCDGVINNLKLQGYAKQNNKCIALLPSLLEKGIISSETLIENLLINKNSIWESIDIRASFFNSGDSLMMIISNKLCNGKGKTVHPIIQHKKLICKQNKSKKIKMPTCQSLP